MTSPTNRILTGQEVPTRRAPTGRVLLRRNAIELGVFAVAFIARVGLVLNGGGFRGSFGYDASVYYAASDALIHGRLPYKDFTFLHPPVVAIALTPFAALGNLFTDHTGFVLACLGFTAIGALCAVLVVRICRKIGVGGPAAAAGGLLYAAWPGSTLSEYLCRLEPLGNFLLLLGLLAFFGDTDSARRRPAAWCGIALGAALSVKIWWILPIGIVAVAYLTPARRQRFSAFAAGLVGSLVVLDGPFFLASPKNMVKMIVVDQLGRPHQHTLTFRLVHISAVESVTGPLSLLFQRVVEVGLIAVVLGLAVLTLQVKSGWVIGALLLADFALLIEAPSYYGFYDDVLAPALAIACAIAVRRRSTAPAHVRRARALWAPVAAASAIAVLASTIARIPVLVQPYPATRLASALNSSRCVMSNHPMALIMLNVLSEDFSNGCPIDVDLEGRRYGVDKPPAGGSTTANGAKYERDLYHYLFRGDALALFPGGTAGLSVAIRRKLARTPVLRTVDGFTVWDTRVP